MVGVVTTDKDYLATTGQAATFAVPAILSVYDDTITANATITPCRRFEAARASNINYRDLYEVANAGCQYFILASMDEVWYRELRDSRTIYSQVTAKKFLAHLRNVCTGLHEIKAITNLPLMMWVYKDVDSIPDYINVLKNSSHRSARATMTIINKQVIAIASRIVLAIGNYDTKCRQHNKLPPDQCTWFSWNTIFPDANYARI